MPTTAPSRWISDLGSSFQLFERAFDDYELYEEDDEFVLTINMPGFERDEITVAWDDGTLNVAGEHTDEARGREKTYHRRFRFPKDIDEDEINASYNNGVLEITLPMVEDATVRGKVIPIDD